MKQGSQIAVMYNWRFHIALVACVFFLPRYNIAIEILTEHDILALYEHCEPRELECVKRNGQKVNISHWESFEFVWHLNIVLTTNRLSCEGCSHKFFSCCHIFEFTHIYS
jgi:hypothetical protein